VQYGNVKYKREITGKIETSTSAESLESLEDELLLQHTVLIRLTCSIEVTQDGCEL
jgi:hypothetical protein